VLYDQPGPPLFNPLRAKANDSAAPGDRALAIAAVLAVTLNQALEQTLSSTASAESSAATRLHAALRLQRAPMQRLLGSVAREVGRGRILQTDTCEKETLSLHAALAQHIQPHHHRLAAAALHCGVPLFPSSLLVNTWLLLLETSGLESVARQAFADMLAAEAAHWLDAIVVASQHALDGLPETGGNQDSPPRSADEAVSSALAQDKALATPELMAALAQSAGARQRARLALHWINRQAQDGLLPVEIRASLPELRPRLICLAIADEGFLCCGTHPVRRWLNQWLDSAMTRRWHDDLNAADWHQDLRDLLTALDWSGPVATRHAKALRTLPADMHALVRSRLARDVSERHTRLSDTATRIVGRLLREHLQLLDDRAALMPLFTRGFEPLLLAALWNSGMDSPAWRQLVEQLSAITQQLAAPARGGRHTSPVLREQIARELIAIGIGAARATRWLEPVDRRRSA
jgi:hypothetical protein